jgi:hypothetical protein
MEEGNWSIKGRYEDAVEDEEDEVVWSFENGQPFICILAVSVQ